MQTGDVEKRPATQVTKFPAAWPKSLNAWEARLSAVKRPPEQKGRLISERPFYISSPSGLRVGVNFPKSIWPILALVFQMRACLAVRSRRHIRCTSPEISCPRHKRQDFSRSSSAILALGQIGCCGRRVLPVYSQTACHQRGKFHLYFGRKEAICTRRRRSAAPASCADVSPPDPGPLSRIRSAPLRFQPVNDPCRGIDAALGPIFRTGVHLLSVPPGK